MSAVRLISFLAAAAAVMLAISLTYVEWHSFGWAEAGCFIGVGLGLFLVRRLGLHHRWLTYRFLAERLRSAHYLGPTGVDFRRTARLRPAHTS